MHSLAKWNYMEAQATHLKDWMKITAVSARLQTQKVNQILFQVVGLLVEAKVKVKRAIQSKSVKVQSSLMKWLKYKSLARKIDNNVPTSLISSRIVLEALGIRLVCNRITTTTNIILKSNTYCNKGAFSTKRLSQVELGRMIKTTVVDSFWTKVI